MNKKLNKIIVLYILIILISFSHIIYSSESSPINSYQNLSDIINALDITKNKYKKKLSTYPNSPTSNYNSNPIKEEYKVFIDYLSLQINNYCTEIKNNFSHEVIKNIKACQTQAVINIFQDENYQTSEEKINSLEDELVLSLGEFDEMLLIEDEKIAKTQSQNRSNQSSQNKSNSNSNSTDMNDSNHSSQGKKISKENNQTYQTKTQTNEASEKSDSYNNSLKGSNTQNKNNQYKRRKLDNNDDDIVARQLKEAAEKETKPELKEKLWNEYYKYKQLTSKKNVI